MSISVRRTSTASQPVTLEIDGLAVTVPEGTSIMRAAAMVGRQVPKLCATDSLKAFGSCRLCLVEIEGRRGYPASCTTLVSDGIKVRTESARLTTLRRGVMELYLSDHPLDCVSCPANGHCELQDMAEELDVTETRYGLKGASHQGLPKDVSNPYFTFDQTMCIACSRCVRACDETQGTFALTIQGRGFASKVSASQNEPFLASECVSCGACVEACPTVALTENSLITLGAPDRVVTTTCGYCGVGCSFKAEVRGEQVVRMVPDRDGHANHGHSCVKGRFAYGYATHPDRITTPMIRASIDEPWRQVSWDEAIGYAASEFRRLQAKYGRDAIGGITSSRCTNEETFLVQKLVRAAFGNNNVDTCARVCHSPTGYGLKSTLGESAGTQAFDSVMKADVIVVIGANPTEGHPVFASQLKRRLREGARLIVVDPRQTALVRSPHIEAACHLQVRPGANVALFNAIAHVIVTDGLTRDEYVSSRCELESYARWKAFVAEPRNSPEATASFTGVEPELVRKAARLYGSAANGAIYYGLGVTEHSQGSTMVMAIANLAMATGNLGREGVGVNPLRGQNNVQGSCDMGSFPHEFSGYRHVSDPARSRHVRRRVGRAAAVGAWPSDSEHVRGRPRRQLQGHVHPGGGSRAVRSRHAARHRGARLDGVHRDPGLVSQRDGEIRARVSAGLVVPGEGRHLHQRRAAVLARAQDHGAARRLPGLGSDRAAVERARISDAVSSRVRDHGGDRAAHADLRRHLVREAGSSRQHPVAVQRPGAGRHADDARRPVREG